MEASKRKPIGKRIRDLKRSLDKTEDPEVAQSKQARIEDLKLLKKLVLKSTNLYNKYKAVRFFGILYSERRKLERQLKHAEKSLDDSVESQERLKQVRGDLSYVKNYPINYKYVSLFSEDSELTIRYRTIMRRHIQLSLARKSEHREKVLKEEMTETTLEKDTEDPFFTEETEKADPFLVAVTAEDVEEEPGVDYPQYRKPREKHVPEQAKSTHIRFNE